jgi:hypothetical protein
VLVAQPQAANEYAFFILGVVLMDGNTYALLMTVWYEAMRCLYRLDTKKASEITH